VNLHNWLVFMLFMICLINLNSRTWY